MVLGLRYSASTPIFRINVPTCLRPTLIIELYYAINEKKASLKVDNLATALKQFYTEVNSARDNEGHADDNVASYHKAALHGCLG